MNARFHAARVGQGMCVVTGDRQAVAETAEDLREVLSAVVAAGCRKVLIDLQDSDYVDPLVLGAILGSHRRLSRFGGEMAVACGSATGYADLERAAVTRVMPSFEERTDAFDWLGIDLKDGAQETPESAR